METLKIRGFIKLVDENESGDGLYVGSEPLSQQLEGISGKQVTVSFFLSDTEKSETELKENLILTMSGCLEAEYGDSWSEYTGYLWTNDDLTIDNHDLIEDLKKNESKFVHINIIIH